MRLISKNRKYLEIFRLIIDLIMINQTLRSCLPAVPEQGSVGASGKILF